MALLEGSLGVLWDKIPDTRVWDMDGAKEIRWGISLDCPQEGVQLILLGERETQLSKYTGLRQATAA